MVKLMAFEDFQTVPVVMQRDMTPYLQVEASDGKSFPLPGEEYHFIRLDLSRALIRHPAQTFFVQICADNLAEAGYLPGSIAVVDREVSPRNRDVALVFLEGEFLLKRLSLKEEEVILEDNEGVLAVEPDMGFNIWGVVKDVLEG